MRYAAAALLCLCVLGSPTVLAQPYRCDWGVVGIAAGGMSGTVYRTGVTAGQTAAGSMTCAQYHAFIGFWQSDVSVGIYERESPVLPEVPVTRLEGIAPNPLRGRVAIRYALATATAVSITVHDITGRQVRELVCGPRPAGRHAVDWRGEDDAGRELANGVYFCRFGAGEVRTTSKLVLAR